MIYVLTEFHGTDETPNEQDWTSPGVVLFQFKDKEEFDEWRQSSIEYWYPYILGPFEAQEPDLG